MQEFPDKNMKRRIRMHISNKSITFCIHFFPKMNLY